MKKILSLLRGKYLLMTFLTPVLMIGEVVMEVFIPRLMAEVVDVGIANQDMVYVTKIGGLMVLMAIASLGFGAFASWTASVAGMGFGKAIRKEMFNKIQDFSFSNVDKIGTSSLITRMTTDVTNTQNSFMMIIRSLVRAPIMLITASVMAFSLNSRLAMVFVVVVPILAVVLGTIMTKAHPRFKEMLKNFDALNMKTQENLIGMRVVKAFVREEYETEGFKDAASAVCETQKKAEKLVIFNMPVMQLVTYFCIIVILWFGGKMIIVGNMGTGDLVSFISYINQILISLMMVAMSFTMIVISKASINRISEVMETTPDIPDNGKEEITVKDGSIEFENVSFSYKDDMENCALKNINLRINSGETVGIIGGTGSSKSSLVHLISRLYEVTSGSVKVGGLDVREYKQNTLRNQVAMVLQKNVLFTGTIKENLLWGNKEATEEQITEACKSAQAEDFILSFPDGYETMLGQGGVNLSGGQKQRLCIARALLKKPKIIILDDSTSAVDTATDAKIRDAFHKKLANITTIIIAQRVSSVCDADKIVVMDNGEISAVGTHEELLKNSEIYREVYESQQKGVA